MSTLRLAATVAPLLAATWFVSTGRGTPPPQHGPDPKTWNQTVDKAVSFLRKNQAPDGSFSKDRSIGITGVVITGVLGTGRVNVNDPLAAGGLKYIESLINTQEGHLAGSNPKVQLKNYVTAVNLMALAAADKEGKYKGVVDRGAKFLKGLQWDEGENISKQSDFFGGFGYDSKNRPDLSNSQMALDALKAAGLDPKDEAFQRAQVFVSRCQNLKSEFQDQPWAAKTNDGSFIYSPAAGGETKSDEANGAKPGYASMTYAGIKSLIYAGVAKDDFRVKMALAWIKKNYSVDANVGMPPSRAQQGLYYYYHTMAKCLDALGVDVIEDDKGVKHDWRKDITEALVKRQRPDGSWVNEADRWMEGDPNLVTGYALMALSYCKPKK
jgi:squalene-hopene/tetraprenyl-beta-curcumene cyclase